MRLTTATALAALFAASPADAQPSRDPAMAEALFASAKALLDQGDWPAACAKFRASMALDPAVSTMLKIAKCHEREGKLALAWSDVHEALKVNKSVNQPEKRRRELEEYARKLLADLEPRVPRIRVRVTGAPAGLRLTYDGRPIPIEAVDEPLPVDPGTHEIVAEAQGYLPLRKVVTLVEGQALDVDLTLAPSVPSADAPSKAPPIIPPSPAASNAPAAKAPAAKAPAAKALAAKALAAKAPAAELSKSARPGNAQRAAGIGVGAFGVAALGAAFVLGVLTMRNVEDAAPYCKPDFSSCNDMKGLTLLHEARGMQTAAFVLLGVGVAGTGAGVVLFHTAPPPRPDTKPFSTILATVGPPGLTLRGAW